MQAAAAGTDTGSARNMSDMYPMSTIGVARASGQYQKMVGGNQFVMGDNSFVVGSFRGRPYSLFFK